jgi:predicted transcriptional regulator
MTVAGKLEELSARVWDDPQDPARQVRTRHIVWYELVQSESDAEVFFRGAEGLVPDVFVEDATATAVRSLSFDAVTSSQGTVPSLVSNNGSLWLTGNFEARIRPVDYGATNELSVSISGDIEQFSQNGGPAIGLGTARVTGQTLMALLLGLSLLFRDALASAYGHFVSAFYTKLRKDKLLDVQARDTLYRLIQQTPGINFLALHGLVKNIEGTAPIAFGALAYHLSQMERFHLIVSKREGRYRRYFDVGANMGADTARVALLQTHPVPCIARAILSGPAQNQAALHASLGAQLGITRQALAYHLKRLEAKELVERQTEGRFHRYVPTDRLRRLSGFLDAAPPTIVPLPAPQPT